MKEYPESIEITKLIKSRILSCAETAAKMVALPASTNVVVTGLTPGGQKYEGIVFIKYGQFESISSKLMKAK